ncbi:glycosyltransferase [Flavobacterium tyrosinilyticum]|uniref:glycosyltransferase n=1 Tax=Flavobacterium tyrosinilyticum TaxID=1658740 RepID=UPI00202EF19C|nr:glycosyltransferase [Flavobacterium tyrosinilyticum]MCM0668646.1 hypothetical protein [Flavobacterium tyrosinilyticum]
MKIAFTICSNNYLAQAKILGDSLLDKNSDYKFIIGLCDEISEDIDYSFFENTEIIPASQFGIYCFDEIIEKYDIVELNTSIKASFFKYLISKYENLETIIYFDPDIQIFNKLSLLEKYLEEEDVLLTPHILNPIGVDDFSPAESSFLNYGIYNLGFLALNPKSQNVRDLLDWWEDKTLKIGFSRVSNGLFVDQLWINLVPIFFNKVKVLHEYGFNAAPWNLHERNLILKTNDEFIMNDNSKLVFYHFSSYNYTKPELFSKYYDRYNSVTLSKEVYELYNQYHDKLIQNKIDFFSKIKCFYSKEEVKVVVKKKSVLKVLIYNIVPPFIIKLVKKVFK